MEKRSFRTCPVCNRTLLADMVVVEAIVNDKPVLICKDCVRGSDLLTEPATYASVMNSPCRGFT